jgi:hypothetical protein
VTLPRAYPARGFVTETFERVAIGTKMENRDRQTIGGRLSTCFSVSRLSATSSWSNEIPGPQYALGIRNNGRARARQDSRDIAIGPDSGDLILRVQMPKAQQVDAGPYGGIKAGVPVRKERRGGAKIWGGGEGTW